MNNLTTRKIVLGMLLTLVLAFSAQGVADALTFQTRTSGDLVTVSRNQEFTITFYPQPKSPVAVNAGTRTASQAERDAAEASGGTGGTAADPHLGYVASTPTDPGTTHYYNTTNDNGTADDTADDFTVKNWLSETNAYYYNDEVITITSGITLTRNGMSLASPNNTLLDRHADSHRRLGTSISLKGRHTTPGLYNITIQDSTAPGDFPPNAQPTSPRNAVRFTIYVVLDRAGTPATPTLTVDAEKLQNRWQ